ncbi:hypothetical protein [Xanthomonas prunicola]|uniref:Uncharacterized protein n=2 Tax=Xanthomonas prunicola TaxID=2053930 RepID=A0A2N3RN33_9XANT|nr:hypothetical protein [Xanthomonas prunicola]PKV13916.1 hypothetical protein XpruCFBP8353_02045 [Xanthomonas prunicola]PKV18196.1 hypothetical protein XpruCFBP8354_02045 [Xanthomonas prunicola]PKV22493.1 hypothetical protein CVO74_04415 [Xanthomonas prunicola]
MNASSSLAAATDHAPLAISPADAARDAVHAGRAAALAAARQGMTQAEHALGEMLRALAAQRPTDIPPLTVPIQPPHTDAVAPLHPASTSGDIRMSDNTQPTPPAQTAASAAQSPALSQAEAALKAAQAQVDQAMAAADMAVQAAMQAANAAIASAGYGREVDSAAQALQQADQAAAAAVAAAQQAEQAMSAGTPDSPPPEVSRPSTPDRN